MTSPVNPYFQNNPFSLAMDVSASYYRNNFSHSYGGGGGGFCGDLYSGACAVGGMGGVGVNDLLSGRFSAYNAARINRIRARYSGPVPMKRKPVPAGTDDPNYANRMKGYFNHRLFGGDGNGAQLPVQGAVLNNLLGPNCEEGMKKEEVKSDNALRQMAEVAYLYKNDPLALAAFKKKWDMASDNAERAMAFFDPLGDGRFRGNITKFMPELRESNDKDRMFEEVGAWLERNCAGALGSAGDELYAYASANAGGFSPLSDSDVLALAGQLEKAGLSKEEAEYFVRNFGNKEEAKQVVDAILADASGKQISSNLARINEIDKKIAEYSNKLSTLESKDKDRAEKEKQFRDEIERLGKERAELAADRARQFLQILMTSRVYHLVTGQNAENMNFNGQLPDGITDINDVTEWISS